MAQGASITWQVTGVSDDTSMTPQNTLVQGKRVAFSTNTGYNGSVFVPASVFADQAAVKRLIEGEVRTVAAAMGLTGAVGG